MTTTRLALLPIAASCRVDGVGSWIGASLCFAAFVLCGACGPAPLADGYAGDSDPKITCTTCHGAGEDPAPPRDLDGDTKTTARGVGAHRAHLRDGAIRAAIACGECHVVPKRVGDKDHVDALPAEITFGPLANARLAELALPPARWDAESMTCATACHGAASTGGGATAPVWTRVDGSQTRCDSCHGAPPPRPHPQSTRCATCHGDTVDDTGRILVAGGRHVNGIVDVKGTPPGAQSTCVSCHGGANDASGAPPVDLAGASATTARGVGAHATHLDGDRHQAVACASCHVAPQAVGDAGHADDDDARAEVTFGALAIHSGAQPRWRIAEASCSNTYCHGGVRNAVPEGAGAPTNANVEVAWTIVDGTASSCDACHGAPPAAPHPARADCASCHGAVVNPDRTFLAPALHVDGVVQSSGTACNACHGGDAGAAPPRDTLGNTTTSAVGVGAHASHVITDAAPAAIPHAAIACSECHRVPENVDDVGHYDSDLPAELAFGPIARARGANPAWDGAACSNIACHGGDGSRSGGTNHAPSWTTVSGVEAACGTCHANPPPAPHPDSFECATCHGDVVDASGAFVDGGARHVNGVVEVACNGCHGGDDSPAPPRDLDGNVDTIFPGVGAHASHLASTETHAPIACTECHRVPSALDEAGHRDDDDLEAEIHFGPLARADATDTAYDGVTCTTYCHGGSASIRGGTRTNPAWTIVDGTQASCGSCHGLPPPAPHPVAPPNACGGCHPFTGTVPLLPELHVNGVVERP